MVWFAQQGVILTVATWPSRPERGAVARLRRPNPSVIVTLVALAMALGETATAAKTLIRGKDIVSGAIGSRQLASGP